MLYVYYKTQASMCTSTKSSTNYAITVHNNVFFKKKNTPPPRPPQHVEGGAQCLLNPRAEFHI